jgi:hypothetical protein
VREGELSFTTLGGDGPMPQFLSHSFQMSQWCTAGFHMDLVTPQLNFGTQRPEVSGFKA